MADQKSEFSGNSKLKSFSAPVYTTPTTINLHSGSKRAIKSHRWNSFLQEFRIFQKLQQGRRSNPPYPAIIYIATFIIFPQRQRGSRCKTIADASSPHIHLTIPAKHVWIVSYHIMLVCQELLCQLGKLLLSKHFRPNGAVCLISPRTVIIISRSIIIPAFPR